MHGALTENGAAKPRRLLMTADTVGGVWTYAVELARTLAVQGFDIVLAAMGGPLTPCRRADLRHLPGIELHESRFKLEWMDDPWDDVRRAGEWLLRIEDDCAPDVVHLNGYAHGALPWRAPRLVVGHSCVLSWWQAVRGEAVPPEWERYRREVARGLRAADAVIAPSAAMGAALLRHYGKDIECAVIPNGRTHRLFRPGIKENFVLTAGRLWDRAKNIAAVTACAPRLSWPLYLAGDEQPPDNGCGAAPPLDNVRRLGRLSTEAVAGWMSRAALYALPAYYEPFGLSALEAGLSGCALVLGDIPSLREIWREAALFVPPGNGALLREALEALISDKGLRRMLAERARRRALEFSPQRMAAAYSAVYQRLFDRASGAARREVQRCAL